MNKKILITGGAGYIGGYLTDTLSLFNDVTVYDNLLYETRYLKNVKFIKGDVRDYKKLSSIINDYDIIICLAAIVGDKACSIEPFISKDVNENSIKWLVDNYKGKIIFTSTCSVYGIAHELIDEDSKTNPLSVYAETKLEAEQYIVKNSNNYLIFRLGTLYGIGDQLSRIRLDLVVNYLTLQSTQNKTLRVFGGEQWRPLLHVKDVSTAIEFCINNNINGLYNLSEINYTIKDIAETIKKQLKNTKIEYNDIKFEDLRNYRVKNDKILSTGWKPQFNLITGILEINKIVLENRIVDLDNPNYYNEGYLKKKYPNGYIS